MDKKATISRCVCDYPIQGNTLGCVSGRASVKEVNKSTYSLSKSLHKFFHRKHSYTVKQGHVKKGKKLFESINDADGLSVDNKPFRKSSRARVWSVRNSFSKSPVENVPPELLKIGSPARIRKKNRRSRTCSYAFDVLHSINNLLLANEENLVIKQNKKLSSVVKCADDLTNLETRDVLSGGVEYFKSFDETQDRSRLSSFGSSACYSDASCCCSTCSCSCCNHDNSDIDNSAMETDVSTSYWDLRIPTESSCRRSGLTPRRYSLSVVTEHQTAFGSPEVRTYLAKRRSSEQPCMFTGFNRNTNHTCWQDKFLHAITSGNCHFKEVTDFTETVGSEKCGEKEKGIKIAIDIPRNHRANQVRRSSSVCGDKRRLKSISRGHRSDEEYLDRRHIQRSRSVDSSYKRRTFQSRERQTSLSSTCQFAFSDIESSEESESTPDPKESSSEGRPQSSCNETSSLSACSASGSSSTERNTPDTSRRKTLDSCVSKMEDVSANSDDITVESVDLSEISLLSLNEKIVNKDSEKEFEMEAIYDKERCTEKNKESRQMLDKHITKIPDSQNLETDLLAGMVEKPEKNEDSVFDKCCELDAGNDSMQGHINAQIAVEAISDRNYVSEDFAEDDFGTDVDLLFQKEYEVEDLCLDLLFYERELEERICEKESQTIRPTSEIDTTMSEIVCIDENNLVNFDAMRETPKAINSSGSEGDKLNVIPECTSSFDAEKCVDNDTSGDIYNQDCLNNDTDIDHVLNYFDSVLHDELEPNKESGHDEIGKGLVDVDTILRDDSNKSDNMLREADEIFIGNKCDKGTSQDTSDNCEENAAKLYTDDKTYMEKKNATSVLNSNEEVRNEENSESGNSKVFEMTDESIQVEDIAEPGNSPEYHKRLLEEILFNTKETISSSDVVDVVDDVDDVFEAMNREMDKEENKDKDMTIMFIVGGELKVIRRSGTLLNGSHGDRSQTDIPSMTRKETPQQNGSRDYVYTRSVHDINRGRPKSAIIVTRSQSFNGMANQQVVMGGRRDIPQAVVLGESFRHHRGGPPMQPPRAAPGSRGAVGFSFKKSPKVPKVPRPNRALLMFQSVKRGIREFIEATKEDIDQLQHRETDQTSTAQGRLHEADKQIKSAERYLKRLEFHHAKLDELHEFYLLQQQLREGVRTMHRAYVTSPGKQTHSLANVKYGYKECTQTMCNIEAQLEAMMGSFNCKLKGMAGFARLCPGDVFEVTVRHGTQKWKTKGRIEKTGNQKWDVPEFNFKAVVGDIFNIKGLEVRAFKSVLLGQKSCETKDLFSANPQLMTVSINVNGSLKLSIVITWNPLDGMDESLNFLEAPQRAQGTPRRRPVSVIALNGQYDAEPGVDRPHSTAVTVQQTKDDNFILRTNPPASHHTNNVTSYHGLDSPHVSSRLSDHLPDAYRQSGPLYSQTSHHIQAGFHSSPAIPSLGESDSDKQLPHPPTQNSAFLNSMPPVMGHLHFPSVSPHMVSNARAEDENTVLNIEDVLHTLTSSLEDYHGQYTELQKLEDLVKFAHKLIRKQFRSSSRSSSISVSIESALEAFDFLDTEEAFEEPRSPTDNIKASFDDMLCSPESTAKTGDSGIESLAQRLSEDTQLGSSLGSSPVPPSTGNEEVDQCLLYHLTYCERLLENLGAFGPLKCREIYALDKLLKQCTIIESLLKLAKSGPHVDLHSVMSTICEDKGLKEFWVKCTDQNSLYIHPDRLLNMLEQKYSSVIAERHMFDPVKVCQHVITRVLDIPDYEAERGRTWFVLTLHQFMLYFSEEGGLKNIEDVAEEMKLVEKLTSGNPDAVIKAILTLRDTLPSSPCLKVIGMLLVTMDKEVEQCTLSYLNLIQKKKENREKALITFVEGLEDRTPEIRSGACAALATLEVTETIDQLVYLWQSDSSSMVQKSAKDALLKLGDEGRKAFEEAQLSKHGFQGIQVHK